MQKASAARADIETHACVPRKEIGLGVADLKKHKGGLIATKKRELQAHKAITLG